MPWMLVRFRKSLSTERQSSTTKMVVLLQTNILGSYWWDCEGFYYLATVPPYCFIKNHLCVLGVENLQFKRLCFIKCRQTKHCFWKAPTKSSKMVISFWYILDILVFLACCLRSSFFAQTSQTHRSCNFKSGIYLVISTTLTQPSIRKPSLSDVVLSSSSSTHRCQFECFRFTLIERCLKCELYSGRVSRCTEQATHDSDASVQSESRNQVRGFHSQSGRTQWRPQDWDATRYPPTRQRRPPRQRHVTAPAQVAPAAKHLSLSPQMTTYLQFEMFLQLLLDQHLWSFNFRSVQ